MAQKIRINTTLELDGINYEVSIAPATKKTKKKIEKTFNKEKEASQAYFDKELALAELVSDIEINKELIEATDNNAEKKELIIEKQSLLKRKRELEKELATETDSIRSKIDDLQEKMFEQLFDEMVSGQDAEKLKLYASDYSFETAVKVVSSVYEKEIEGK